MEVTKAGRLKDMFSNFREPTDEEREKEQALLDAVLRPLRGDGRRGPRPADEDEVRDLATGEIFTAEAGEGPGPHRRPGRPRRRHRPGAVAGRHDRAQGHLRPAPPRPPRAPALRHQRPASSTPSPGRSRAASAARDRAAVAQLIEHQTIQIQLLHFVSKCDGRACFWGARWGSIRWLTSHGPESVYSSSG